MGKRAAGKGAENCEKPVKNPYSPERSEAKRLEAGRVTMPNFLVIGAAKAGTTALYRYLGQHPQVYTSPVKEPKFFALEGEMPNYKGPGDHQAGQDAVTNLEGYQTLFEGVSGEKAVGEASPLYLYSEKAPGRIRHYVPQAKLVAVLRDPVDRAYSSFLHKVRDGREPLLDFAQALAAEEERIQGGWAPGWHYKRRGFYHEQLSRYHEAFERGDIRTYLYEDLQGNLLGVLKDLFSFLGVDGSFIPDVSLKHNVSGVPRSRFLHSLLRGANPVKSALKPFLPEGLRRRAMVGLQNRNLKKPPGISPEMRRRLVEEYREDILKLEELIGRDLSGWLR